MPESAAADAAPIRKLCPVKPVVSTPKVERTCRMWDKSLSFDSGEPSWNKNNGPGRWPRCARYPSRAATGQMVTGSA